MYQSLGQYAKAEPLSQQALAIRKQGLGEQHPDYAASLNNLGWLYHSRGEYAKAEPLYRQALAVWKESLGDQRSEYAIGLQNLAALYISLNDYAQAEPLYRQIVNIRKSTPGEADPSYGDAVELLADCYGAKRDYVQCLTHSQHLVEIRKAALGENDARYGLALINLGWAYRNLGDYAKAEASLSRACEVLKRVRGPSDPFYAKSLSELANVYSASGHADKALPLTNEALEIRHQLFGEESQAYAEALHDAAVAHISAGKLAMASVLLERACDLDKKLSGEMSPTYANSLNTLGNLYLENGAPEKAIATLQRSLQIDDVIMERNHPDRTRVLQNLAIAHEGVGNLAKADEYCRRELDMQIIFAEQTLPWLPEATAMSMLESIEFGPDRAIALKRRHDASTVADLYPYVWRSKGMLANAFSQRRRLAAESPGVGSLVRELETVRQELAQLTLATVSPQQQEARRKRLDQLNDRKESLESHLARDSEGFRRSQQVRQMLPEELMAVLPDDVAVVDFVHVKTRRLVQDEKNPRYEDEAWYEAFVLRHRPAGREPLIDSVRLGSATTIDSAIADWRKTLSDAENPQSGLPMGKVVRQHLWSPIERYLAGCSQVVIIPDGDLNFVPWAALPGKRPGTYMVEDYGIAAASSGQQLCGLLREERCRAAGVLLVGGVKYDQKALESPPMGAPLVVADKRNIGEGRSTLLQEHLTWPFLKGTIAEVEAIRDLWKTSPEPELLQGAEAGKKALRQRMPQHGYIHLATHGFFANDKFRSMLGQDAKNDLLFQRPEGGVSSFQESITKRNPLVLSGIVLAGANLLPQANGPASPTSEDGVLTAEEIVGLNLRGTELVVLSACETGLGKLAGGEGVMGLSRAFHLAGARSVVASLWTVNDNATKALMVEFYRNLWERKLPKVEALRQAQLTMLRKYDPTEGKLRGAWTINATKAKLDPDSPALHTTSLPPFYWAAFVLSGDWR